MCDTLVATAEATWDGRVVFAKNSDREPGEAEVVEIRPAATHGEGARVRCTYLDLPEVRATRRVLLCRPYWMWGAEMGVNDAGVVIGNEAVFTRAPHSALGLTGMDLVRLGLERAADAESAVRVVGELVETHGQGGNAGHRGRFRYHNSFLIADRHEAWVLETAAKAWVAKRVSGVRSISNALTVGDDWDLSSRYLRARARDYGLSPGKARLDFRALFANPWMDRAANALTRRGCTEAFLERRRGRISALTAMEALRQHGAPDRPSAALVGLGQTVCAHAGALPTRSHGQTVGSLVVTQKGDELSCFVTATAAPCLSLFKPVRVTGSVPSIGEPTGRYDPSCLWWRHERLHRRALADLELALAHVAPRRAALEAELASGAEPEAAFARADAEEGAWLEALEELLPRRAPSGYWRGIDRGSGFESGGRASRP